MLHKYTHFYAKVNSLLQKKYNILVNIFGTREIRLKKRFKNKNFFGKKWAMTHIPRKQPDFSAVGGLQNQQNNHHRFRNGYQAISNGLFPGGFSPIIRFFYLYHI